MENEVGGAEGEGDGKARSVRARKVARVTQQRINGTPVPTPGGGQTVRSQRACTTDPPLVRSPQIKNINHHRVAKCAGHFEKMAVISAG